MSHNFFEHYALLGLRPGAGWRELKAAYRKQIRTWHPDRFQGDPDARARAEELTKSINRAYHELTQYYRQHAALPLTHDTSESPRSGHYAPAARPDSSSVSPTFRASPLAPWRTVTPSVRYGAALLGSVAVLLLLVKMFAPHNAPAPSAPITPIQPAVTPTDNSTSAPRKEPLITYGSTMGEVYAVQGVPSRTEPDVWHYGTSKIYFRNGAVLRWEEDRDHPLKTHIVANTSLAQMSVFGKGSTKSEVRSIQGTPIRESDKMWDYGVSRVYFQGDLVVDWYESPLGPLKVKRSAH